MLDAQVNTHLTISEFIRAAKQFINDENLSRKYWPKEYCNIIHELSGRLHLLYAKNDGNVRLEDVFK